MVEEVFSIAKKNTQKVILKGKLDALGTSLTAEGVRRKVGYQRKCVGLTCYHLLKSISCRSTEGKLIICGEWFTFEKLDETYCSRT